MNPLYVFIADSFGCKGIASSDVANLQHVCLPKVLTATP